jgi:hypothetical protein
MVYTDGISLTNSNCKEFWPVFVSLVELPHQLRDSNKNKIIAGVWLGKKKPTSEIIFNSLFQEVRQINNTALLNVNPIESNDVDNSIFLEFYGFIADLPAKAEMLNMIGHNGYSACTYCLHPGS